MFLFLPQRRQRGPFCFAEVDLSWPGECVNRSFSVTQGQGPSCLLSKYIARELGGADPCGMGLKKGGQRKWGRELGEGAVAMGLGLGSIPESALERAGSLEHAMSVSPGDSCMHPCTWGPKAPPAAVPGSRRLSGWNRTPRL